MIDDDLVLRVERLRDALKTFRDDLRKRYALKTSRVSANTVRKDAARLAETWVSEISSREDVRLAIAAETFAETNVQFQRLLSNSEHVAERKQYDKCLASILNDFGTKIVVPLKSNRGLAIAVRTPPTSVATKLGSVFVGQSFATADKAVVEVIKDLLDAYGLKVVTGRKPAGSTISSKVRGRIESCDLFVGVFTRGDKLSGSDQWSTSAWVVDEKAFAMAKDKRIILIKEEGVKSIGGLQGDYEFLDLNRAEMATLLIGLVATLRDLDGK